MIFISVMSLILKKYISYIKKRIFLEKKMHVIDSQIKDINMLKTVGEYFNLFCHM